jgi:flagellar assembly protein FliH
LATQPESVLDLVKTTLSWAVGAETVRLRLHPADCDFVETRSADLSRECTAETQFVRDETLSRGDCLVETAQGLIDGRIETILDRIADELLGD